MPTPGKLGKLPAVHDPRTLRLENYLSPKAAPTPPAARDWTHGITAWSMMLNDQIGCCTCSAMGHAEQLWTANTSSEVTVPDSAVLAAYEAVGGYVPGQPQTDQGAELLTALKYWMNTGINGHKIAGYASVPLTQVWIETAIDLFGLAYIGFAVPKSAMQQFEAGQPWAVVANDGGIEGGHCIILGDYAASGPEGVTWAAVEPMTWPFFAKYCSMNAGEGEAYAVITQEWLAANGTSPSGLNWAQMQADIADVQSQTPPPMPSPTPAPFVPNPTIIADINWFAGTAATTLASYRAGDVATAAADLQIIGAYGTQLGRYLAGIGGRPGR